MKKKITIAICLFMVISTRAQTGLTLNNFVTTGAELVQHQDTNNGKFFVASGNGAGNIWDFAELQSNTEETKYKFYNADWLPEIAKLHSSTNQIVEVNDGESFQFRSISERGIIEVARALKGIGGALDLEVFEDTLEHVRFPLNFGDTAQSDTTFIVTVADAMGVAIDPGFVDSIRVDIFVANQYQIEGLGELRLPNNFDIKKALMLSKTQVTFATFHLLINNQWLPFSAEELRSFGANVSSPEVHITHSWYDLDKKNALPLLEYEHEAGSIYASNIRFLGGPVHYTSTKKIGLKKGYIYPNPANQYVNIVGVKDQNSAYQIVDLFGKQVARGNMKDGRINVDRVIPGVYIVKLVDETSEPVTLKFQKR